jgi:hypothetical protein
MAAAEGNGGRTPSRNRFGRCGVEDGMRRALITLVGLSLLAGCGSDGEGSSPSPELTEQYACGYGFYASNAEQTVGLFIDVADFDAAGNGDVPDTSRLEPEKSTWPFTWRTCVPLSSINDSAFKSIFGLTLFGTF